jgi:hypothetical protein
MNFAKISKQKKYTGHLNQRLASLEIEFNEEADLMKPGGSVLKLAYLRQESFRETGSLKMFAKLLDA